MKQKIYSCILAVVTLMMSSCTEWLTIEPEDEVVKDKLFLSEQGFWDAINGTYTLLWKSHGPASAYNAGFVDNLANLWQVGNQSLQYKLGRFQYKDADVETAMASMFLNQYNVIAHVNTILSYIDKADFLRDDVYKLIKGEALGIRAWAHMDVLRVWGPMPGNVNANERYLPYVKSVSKQVNVYETYKEYVANLVTDLDSAAHYLKDVDPICKYSNSQLNDDRVALPEYTSIAWYWRQNRFNYYAAIGLRARVALWLGDNEGAFQYASMVIDAANSDATKKFRLGTGSDLEDDATNRNFFCEHLFSYAREYYNYEQEWNGSIYTTEGKVHQLFTDQNDIRLTKWWKNYTDDPSKFMTTKHLVHENNYTGLIRLAEMYMIAIETGDLASANSLYQDFCESRNETFNELTERTRKETILAEYYREFMGEGEIFFLNKRYATKRMKWAVDDSYEPQYVLPIPKRESEIFN